MLLVRNQIFCGVSVTTKSTLVRDTEESDEDMESLFKAFKGLRREVVQLDSVEKVFKKYPLLKFSQVVRLTMDTSCSRIHDLWFEIKTWNWSLFTLIDSGRSKMHVTECKSDNLVTKRFGRRQLNVKEVGYDHVNGTFRKILYIWNNVRKTLTRPDPSFVRPLCDVIILKIQNYVIWLSGLIDGNERILHVVVSQILC